MSLSASTTHDDGTAAAPEQPVRDRANAPSRGPVRVLLVADTEIIVRGLAGLLDRSRDRVELLGPISASDDVAAAAAAYRADVVLVDADRKGGVDVALLARLLGASEGLRLVVFTHSSDERRLFEALRAGTAGYLLKSLSAVELVHHLERARDGQVVIDPSLASRLALARRPPWPEPARERRPGPARRRSGQPRDRRAAVRGSGDGEDPPPLAVPQARRPRPGGRGGPGPTGRHLQLILSTCRYWWRRRRGRWPSRWCIPVRAGTSIPPAP